MPCIDFIVADECHKCRNECADCCNDNLIFIIHLPQQNCMFFRVRLDGIVRYFYIGVADNCLAQGTFLFAVFEFYTAFYTVCHDFHYPFLLLSTETAIPKFTRFEKKIRSSSVSLIFLIILIYSLSLYEIIPQLFEPVYCTPRVKSNLFT